MNDRICAHCGKEIPEKPQVLFCSRYCTLQYLHDHAEVPTKPVVA